MNIRNLAVGKNDIEECFQILLAISVKKTKEGIWQMYEEVFEEFQLTVVELPIGIR